MKLFFFQILSYLLLASHCRAEDAPESGARAPKMQHTLPTQSMTISRLALRQSHDKEKTPFPHTRSFFEALRTGKKTLEYLEKTDHTSAASWKIENFEDTIDKAYTLVLSKFTLREGEEYVHLNNAVEAGGQVESKSDRHLTHCASDISTNRISTAKADSILIGHAWENPDSLEFSHRVVAVSHRVEQDRHCTTLQLEELHPLELFAKLNVQALIERPFHNTVNPVGEDEGDSAGQVLQEQTEGRQGERELQYRLPPSAPLIACDDKQYKDNLGAAKILGYSEKSFKGATVRAAAGSARGCASFDYAVPGSISVNYNPVTKAAKEAISLGEAGAGIIKAGENRFPAIQRAMEDFEKLKKLHELPKVNTDFSGVVACDNCFIVAGAGAIVILNYEFPKTWTEINIRAQVKFGGDAGAAVVLTGKKGNFNINVGPFKLLPKAHDLFSIPVPILANLGLTVKFIFNSAELSLKGTGSTEGSFIWGEGALATAAVWGGYSSTKLSSGRHFELGSDFTTKSFKARGNDKFRLDSKSWKVSATVIARINVELILGGLKPATDTIKATFYAALETTGTLESPTGTGGKLYDLHLAAADRRELWDRRRPAASTGLERTTIQSTLTVYRPGDVIEWTHKYAKFNPNEVAHVYSYLVNAATGAEFPIKNQVLYTGSGSGTIRGEWTVPWNLNLADLADWIDTDIAKDPSALALPQGLNQGMYLKVRTDIWGDTATVQSLPFRFDLFSGSNSDGIFDEPAAGAHLRAYAPISATWDASLLHSFQPGVLKYTGKDVSTAHVDVELIMEKLDEDGNVASSRSDSLASGIANTGHALLHFNSTITGGFDRFYLLLSDSSNRRVQGWSKGYFSLDNNNLRSFPAPPRTRKVASHTDLHQLLHGHGPENEFEVDARLQEALETRSLFPPAPAPHAAQAEERQNEAVDADALRPQDSESRALTTPKAQKNTQKNTQKKTQPQCSLPWRVNFELVFGVASVGFHAGPANKEWKFDVQSAPLTIFTQKGGFDMPSNVCTKK